MTEESLEQAEQFIEKNNRNVVDECAQYANVKPFKFLPGHKALIFGIQTQLEEFQQNKRQTAKKKMKLTHHVSEQELQLSLVHQMLTFTKNLKLDAVWSKECIKESTFTVNNDVSQCICTVSCPLCFSPFVVRYDKHWKTSNLCKHMRKHSNNAKTNSFHASASALKPNARNNDELEELIEVDLVEEDSYDNQTDTVIDSWSQ